MRTIAWREVAGTVVLIHGESDPTDAEWAEYLAALRRRLEQGPAFRALVVTPGSGPNMRQRKQLNEVFGGQAAQAAVVTASAVGRAVVTLLGLRNPGIRAFDPDHLDDALAFLALPSDDRARMRLVVSELRRQVGLAELG